MLHKLSSEAKDLWSNSKEKVLSHHSVYQTVRKEQPQADYFALAACGHQQCPTAESFVLLEPSLIVTVLGKLTNPFLGRLLIR